jgi:hypothetical protein
MFQVTVVILLLILIALVIFSINQIARERILLTIENRDFRETTSGLSDALSEVREEILKSQLDYHVLEAEQMSQLGDAVTALHAERARIVATHPSSEVSLRKIIALLQNALPSPEVAEAIAALNRLISNQSLGEEPEETAAERGRATPAA